MVAIGPSQRQGRQVKLIAYYQQHRRWSYTYRMTLPLAYRGAIVALLVILTHWILWSSVDAKPLYSYADEKGTRIITDDYKKIPPSYRAKVTPWNRKQTDTSGISNGSVNWSGPRRDLSFGCLA